MNALFGSSYKCYTCSLHTFFALTLLFLSLSLSLSLVSSITNQASFPAFFRSRNHLLQAHYPPTVFPTFTFFFSKINSFSFTLSLSLHFFPLKIGFLSDITFHFSLLYLLTFLLTTTLQFHHFSASGLCFFLLVFLLIYLYSMLIESFGVQKKKTFVASKGFEGRRSRKVIRSLQRLLLYLSVSLFYILFGFSFYFAWIISDALQVTFCCWIFCLWL